MSGSSFETGEGFLSAEIDPSSRVDFVHATFSHKGRREAASATVLYEIPITSPSFPSRKPMRPVAPQPGRTHSRIFGCAVHVAEEHPMLDLVMLALALGLFVAGIGYAYVCERL